MFLPLVAAAATLAVIVVVVVATTTFACSFSSLLLNGNIGHNTYKHTLTHNYNRWRARHKTRSHTQMNNAQIEPPF